jgi:hypothetical protein
MRSSTLKRRRSLIRFLGPALLLLAAGLVLPARGAFAAYPAVAHVDGYLSANGGCMMLRQHDGATLSVVGSTAGLAGGDHVRLEGRLVPDPGCGAPGFEVMLVQTLWADDNHRTTYFDHLNGETFQRYAERTGRLEARPGYQNEKRGYENERRGYESERRSYENERRDYDRNRYGSQQRPDRWGRYVYQGPHRSVTLVGKLHETAGACPTLATTHAVFALDGNLGDYQAGDMVKVSGILYDGDPNAPCGGATVVVSGIRGR